MSAAPTRSTGPGPGRSGATALHLSPHADDELVGSPAALFALRDAGWRIVNVLCSLGHERQRARREREAREASRLARFELRLALVGEDFADEERLGEAVAGAIEDEHPVVVIAPSPHDAHPRHEAVGRAAVAACERHVRESESVPRLWLWGLWADLPMPTLAVAFGETRMREVLGCLEVYEGELRRNDYRRLVRGRAEMNASLGPERVFGFGSAAAVPRAPTHPGQMSDHETQGQREADRRAAGLLEPANAEERAMEPSHPESGYVELLSEAVLVEGGWQLGRPRWLEPEDPLGLWGAGREAPEAAVPIGRWLHEPSPSWMHRPVRDLR